MDVNHRHLKYLADQTNAAFEQFKQCPASDDCAQAYEDAKSALDHHMLEIRLSMLQKGKKI
ncbi:MAG: hypothetical protein ACI9LX_000463 [Paraglaciecola sp.]|jgi:hypothetical protein